MEQMEGAMRRRKEAGQAIILTAAALVVLIGFMSFAIDMGVARYEKRVQQTAADAAALAGASNLGYGGVTAAAQDASALDGYTDNGGGNVSACGSGAAIGTVCVQINNPPATGPHASDPKYVEALVAAVHTTYFARILGINQQTITARAVATNLAGPPGSNSTTCWLSLGAPQNQIQIGDSVSGTPQVNAQYCTIEDNGDLCTNGTATVTAGAIAVSGQWGGINGGGGSCTGGTVSPQPVTGVPAVGDPVAGSITDPCPGGTGGACTNSLGQLKINSTGNCTLNGGACGSAASCASGQCTVNPGTYNSICINVNAGTTVNFNSGLYVMTGSSTCNAGTDFSVNAQATICNSSTPCSGMPGTANGGVTFYMTGSGSVNIAGGATAELTAPNSGTYEGILFYQDPTDTATASIEGNANSFYQGALYFPTARLVFGGTSGTFNAGAAYTFLIAQYTTVDGTATIDINSDVSGLSGGGGPLAGLMTTARLVE
jgi:hypothetical protein